MSISAAMNAKLNEQITAEFSAAHSYLTMSASLEKMGLKVLAKRFLDQHEEERGHGLKIFKYVQDVGGEVALDAVAKPKSGYKSVEAIAQAALDSEQEVTRLIHELVALADKEKDYSTRSFLGWFVDEQVEEVASMTDLLRLVRLAGKDLLEVETRVRHEMQN